MTTVDNLLGQPVDRVDGRAKVTGTARYAAEFAPAELLYAAAVQSPIASGKLLSLDLSSARSAIGVVNILTPDNMSRLKTPSLTDKAGRPGSTFIPIQNQEIHYAGQYLALVIADTSERARFAASRVRIRCAESPVDFWDGHSTAPAKTPPALITGDKPDTSRGDLAKGLAQASSMIRASYISEQENHNPMELSAAVAAWKGDELTIYTATQWIDGVQHVISEVLQIPTEKVRVICPFVGGGFGCKGCVWAHEFLTAAAARVVGRPVQFVLTRPQMFVGAGCRPMIRQDIALGASADGRLTAISHDVFNHTSKTDPWTEPAALQTPMLYSCPNVATTHRLIEINTSNPCQMRAPGHAPGTWALEVAMDELAHELHLDPLELRLRNYAEKDEHENLPFSSKSLRACYLQGAARFGWSKRNPLPGSARDGRTLIGYGMATATYPAKRQNCSARVQLLPDGSARVTSATHDIGTGMYTVMTQLAAQTLGLPLDRVQFELGDSDFPPAPVTGGSWSTASVGSAVDAACLKARAALFQAASQDAKSPFSGQSPDALAMRHGELFNPANEARTEPLATFLGRRGAPIDVTAEAEPPEKPEYSPHAFGAQFAEVHVDSDLMQIRVARTFGAFAAGRILNLKTARSQILGGTVMGIGMALFEGTVYDPVRHKIANDNLADYLVPVNPDIHEMDCMFIDEPDPRINPIGVKGIGEIGTTGIAAAITNAVFNATGRRFRRIPIRIEDLLR